MLVWNSKWLSTIHKCQHVGIVELSLSKELEEYKIYKYEKIRTSARCIIGKNTNICVVRARELYNLFELSTVKNRNTITRTFL